MGTEDGHRSAETVGSVGEFGLIDLIEKQLETQQASVIVGIGDDTACYRPLAGMLQLATCDVMVEGRHFLPKYASPFDVGYRAIAINVSDIGAMGGVPRQVLVSLGLRKEMPVQEVLGWYEGMAAAVKPFGAAIVGGNISSTDGPLFIDITVLGEVEEDTLTLRSGACPGDEIMVTGQVGEALAGLLLLESEVRPRQSREGDLLDVLERKYLRPEARALVGRALALECIPTSMIDTSDGFLGDLSHIVERSGVGVELEEDAIPVSEALQAGADVLGMDPLDLVWRESDDYELIFTCRREGVDRARDLIFDRFGLSASRVGSITDAHPEMNLTRKDGRKMSLSPRGWDHFASSPSPSDR